MSKKLNFCRQNINFVVCLITTLFFGNLISAYAQVPPGISISWDKEVGCQTYSIDKDKRVFIEDIGVSDCIRFCEFSSVSYTLSNIPTGSVIAWTAAGGTVYNSTSPTCLVSWGSVGTGSISFTITNGNSIINKTICIEKIVIPQALFEITGAQQASPVYTCSNQIINFTNLSTTNNGTNLVSYLWDFGDETTSTAFEPSHIYLNDDEYTVTLTVRNECNCTDVYKITIYTKGKGFEISCPTVICEGQSEVYSLPFDGMQICEGNFNWSVIGGHILSQGGGNVEVLWDNVDDTGFGYITFNPQNCNLECLEPTTIKVPVIKSQGTIQGLTELCLGEQGRYKLPQWPTTDIQWQIIGNVGNSLANIYQTDQRNEIIVDPLVAGPLTLRATYTNTLLHCSGEAEIVINVSKPTEVLGPDTLCQFSNETYSNSDGANANWILTSNNGTYLASSNGTTFNYTFNNAGNFILTANANGYCAGEQQTITVVGKPTVPTGIEGDLLVCPNSLYTYVVQTPDPTSNYYWGVTNGYIVGEDTADEVNIIFTSLPAEVKVYQKTISPVECISDPYIITINQIPVNVEIVSDDPYAICANSLASYQAVVPGTSNLYADGDTYTWSFANSSSSVLASSLGSVTSGQGTNSIDVTWNNVSVVTTLDLVLTVSKCNISPAPQFVRQITLNPKTEIKITTLNNPVCGGNSVTFTVESANGVPLSPLDVITWNTGSGDFTTPAGQVSYTTSYSNNSTLNIGQVVTAYIANSNNCGQTNTFSYTLTVLPNPPAIATLSGAANAFCTPQEIDTYISVSSTLPGTTNFQWFHNGTLIPGETGTSIHVLYPMEPGAYTFQATNPNGCITVSNPVSIFVVSCTQPNCTINETLENNSELTACGQITFSGLPSGTPLSEEWLVLGPAPTDYSISGNILTGKPGNYKIIYKVGYPCQEGGVGYITKIKDVVIPYEPDFSYVIECAGNNSFNVNFIDNSNFYAQVSPQNVDFYYKASGAVSFIGPIAYDPSLTVFEIQNLAAGNYVFRLEISGSQANTPTFTCSKEYTVNLQGVNPTIFIEILNPINCHNTAVKFQLSPLPPPGTTVLWDFDDDLAQNTLTSPERVFNTPDTIYNVTCTVTNQYGCSRIIPIDVFIPKECFFGDIVADPVNATVCKDETVELTYVSTIDNCTNNLSYVWMNGSDAVVGAPNSSQLTVTTTGFYWVKVISEDGCEYASPTQIKPVFNTLPNVKLFGESTFCEGEEVKLQVSTSAANIRWFINGNLYSQFNDQLQAVLSTVLSAGNYIVLVEVTSTDGCINSASQTISIEEAIHGIDMDVSIQCTPSYEVTITANPQPANPAITYNWSNGESTQTIVVADGGPYKVTATLGGCSLSAVVNVPKNPENYIWIFPTGCYTDCSTELNYLIGPTLPLPEWSWNLNGNPDQSGVDSYATPYTLIKDGSYTFSLNTGVCELESETLDYSTTKCDKCKIEKVYVKEIVKNDLPYCSYTFHLVIYSASTTPYQATIMDNFNNVILIPSSFTLQPGANYLQFTVIPQNPFTGGPTQWTIQGSVPVEFGYEDCFYDFEVRVPTCEGYNTKTVNQEDEKTLRTVAGAQDIKIYPNPATDLVTISYTLNTSNAIVEIYDLSGRSISQKVLSSSSGTIQLQTNTYQAGIYIVVVKENDTILLQQKLIIE